MKHSAFAQWLIQCPPAPENGQITVEIPVTLDARDWLDIARVAAAHGDSLASAVNKIVADGVNEDSFANDEKYRYEELAAEREARRQQAAAT